MVGQRHAERAATRRDPHHTMGYDQGIPSMWLRRCCVWSVCRTLGVVSTAPTGPGASGSRRAEDSGAHTGAIAVSAPGISRAAGLLSHTGSAAQVSMSTFAEEPYRR